MNFMDIITSFSENLAELIDDCKLTVEQFAKTVDIAYSEVYRYLRKEYLPILSNVIKIADRYHCSVDYLLGFIPYPENTDFIITPPFNIRFKQLLEEFNITRYRLNKATDISLNRLDDWYNGKYTPSLEKALILKKYFKCSLDYLLGREN